MPLSPFSRRKSVALPVVDNHVALSMSTLPTLTSSQPPLSAHHVPAEDLAPPYAPGDISNVTIAPVGQDISEKKIKFMDRPMIKLFKDDVIAIYKYIRRMDWKEFGKLCMKRSMYKWYAIVIVAIILTALLSANHEAIVDFCRPISRTIRDFPGGWLIPIVILVVLSFPPLVGHEVVGILIGLVYGIGVGFAILAAGTFLGEIATWVAFKWCCQARAAKFEKKNKLYACLTQLIREKSFMFVLVLRFSAVPGHMTTAVSASAGANFWMYLLAAFLTLPKQFTIVYLGQAYGEKSFKNTLISTIATVITLLGTVVAAIYIYYQMRMVMLRNAAMDAGAIIDTGDGPTWADLEAGGPTNIGTGPRGSVALPTDEKDLSLSVVEPVGMETLHSRRPWLQTVNSSLSSMSTKKGARARSLPGNFTEEEIREWNMEMENDSRENLSRLEESPDDKIEIIGQPPQFSPEFLMSSRIPDPSSSTSPTRNSFTLPTAYIQPDGETSNDLYPPSRTSWGDGTRGTVSLDIARPLRNSRSLGNGLSGREIADDADAYAQSRGARRPDYGRYRGESRAALLGRPDEDTLSDTGSARRL